MLEEKTRRRAPTREIMELERREQELWLEYRHLDRMAKVLADSERASKEQIKRARRRAVRAHRDHQGCVNAILKIHRDRLFAEARDDVSE